MNPKTRTRAIGQDWDFWVILTTLDQLDDSYHTIGPRVDPRVVFIRHAKILRESSPALQTDSSQ